LSADEKREWRRRTIALCLLVVAGLLTCASGETKTRRSRPLAVDRHVVIIGIDGLGAANLRGMALEHIGHLIKDGASTLRARGVWPTVSSPNWASMIMGTSPDFHGVLSNEWKPKASDRFPTIFGIARATRPASVIGIFHQWEGFAQLVEPGVADVLEHLDTAGATAERAASFIRSRRPTLTFVHLDLVDLAGHEFGWDSADYRRAVRVADTLVGLVLAAVHDSGMEGETAVLVSADHGGTEYDHGRGAATLRELEIPWIACGAGIVRGVVLNGPVSTSDTAPTVAALLGLPVPIIWTGRPVTEAFEPQ
jgi:predicted AlkP superfamily pyrophosphatase or phosphodiesterase